ncbi:low affinity immunoglobulin epsilon Fc receptor-like [Saccostrea echinata]|uniref:low affinity immunoglobulin epsilon Fc receptor-like n=1 Tax=Saccostrea echinata TaxID=191078 RepID=UPI002A83B0C3|nr:low affinity immunoglobulin epsilon Fc receptor-like [Saccostrea echinata]
MDWTQSVLTADPKIVTEQNSKLLQIEERMQTKLTNLENRVKNITKEMSTKSCPSNWIPFGSSCYNIRAQEKSWYHAAMECLQYGAKLVEIETKQENDFLKQRIRIYDEDLLKQNITTYSEYKKFWIGGTDKIIEGRFVWASTGNLLSFTDWDAILMEPNDRGGNEDCIEISSFPTRRGIWNDANCAAEFYFICERSL